MKTSENSDPCHADSKNESTEGKFVKKLSLIYFEISNLLKITIVAREILNFNGFLLIHIKFREFLTDF